MTTTRVWRPGYAYERQGKHWLGDRFIVCASATPGSIDYCCCATGRHGDDEFRTIGPIRMSDEWEELPLTEEEQLRIVTYLMRGHKNELA